jgi:hypothetical protein
MLIGKLSRMYGRDPHTQMLFKDLMCRPWEAYAATQRQQWADQGKNA